MSLSPAASDAVERLAYRPTEAAAALGISRAGLYNLLNAGVIRSVKLGSSRRIPRGELERVLRDAG